MNATTNNATTKTTSKYVKWSQWDTQANRYMQPKTTDRGLKTVTIISTQKNKKLHIQIPSMTCWGITDYVDPSTGESDGKFSIKLHFSGKDNLSEDSKNALEKLKNFEEQILQDAVSNSEAWFGKRQTREIVEYGYFPFLKMGKNSETKQPDPEKGVYFRPKVNCYSGSWDVEIFDPEGNPLFPNETEDSSTPMDFVPSGSEVTCGIECKQIWIGAKGWGISWALKQCVVIPKISENIKGKLQLEISDKDKQHIYTAPILVDDTEGTNKQSDALSKEKSTYIENSDDEDNGKNNYQAENVEKDEEVENAEEVEEAEKKDEEVEEAEKKEEERPIVKKTVVKRTTSSTTPKSENHDKEDVAEQSKLQQPVKKKVVRKKTSS